MAIHHSFRIPKEKKSTSGAKNKATLRPKEPTPSPINEGFEIDTTDGPAADFQWDIEAIDNSRVVFPLAPEAWETTFGGAQESDTTQASQQTSEDDTTLEISEEYKPGTKATPHTIPGWFMTGDTGDSSEIDSSIKPPGCFDWVKMFFEPKGTSEFQPLDWSSHFSATLTIAHELYTPGCVVNPITAGYVISGKSTHAYFNPVTGSMTPWIHQPAPRASNDKETNTTLRTIRNTDCLNVGDPSYWWNVRVSSNYCHLGEVSSNRTVAGLFNTSNTEILMGATEICVIRCFQPFAKEASHSSQFYTFEPQKEKEKYKLRLAGSPTTNLFLVESYKADIHYIYLLTSSLNSSLPHYKLVLSVNQISRTQKSGNLRGKEWWGHRILTFGDNLAIFKEGRLAVWRIIYDPSTDAVKTYLVPERFGFIADVHPVQFGKHLIFSRGVLDMSTFEFCTVPVSENGRKKIVWHKRDGELIGSTVNNLTFQCFYLGEPFEVQL